MTETYFLFGLLILLSISMGFTFFRLILGPSVADRGLAFDVFASIAMGWIVVAAKLYRSPHLLDTVFALAFLSFIGTLGLVYLMEETKKA